MTTPFKSTKLGFYHTDSDSADKLVRLVSAIELGRLAVRDIAGSDPERMSASKIHEYVEELFRPHADTVKMTVVQGQENFVRDYPCFAAVNRASVVTPRHDGRVIKLEYESSDGPIDTTLFLVGKVLI